MTVLLQIGIILLALLSVFLLIYCQKLCILTRSEHRVTRGFYFKPYLNPDRAELPNFKNIFMFRSFIPTKYKLSPDLWRRVPLSRCCYRGTTFQLGRRTMQQSLFIQLLTVLETDEADNQISVECGIFP